MRPPDHETACGVDKIFGVFIQKLLGKDWIENIFFDVLMDLFLSHILIMLGGKNYRFQTDGLACLVILHRNLALAIGS